jgi:GntR family transcriptional regulator / MocR family aminotransferase
MNIARTDMNPDQAHFPLAISSISVNMSSPTPIYSQLCAAIRSAIMSGELPAGTMMPTSREFAVVLGVGRNTVNAAYSRLGAEGYLEAKFRRGTRVVPGHTSHNKAHPSGSDAAEAPALRETGREINIAYSAERTLRELDDTYGDVLPLSPFAPDPTLFPRAHLARLLSEKCGRPPSDDSGLEMGVEFRRFQNAVATHVRRTTGIVCKPAQILPMAASECAIDLVARLTIDAGHVVQMESPSCDIARAIFRSAGARLYEIPRDSFGANPDLVSAPPARLVFVSSSLSFPFGVQMPDERRQKIVDHARASGALILETDLDGELLFTGARLKTIQALEPNRVIYFGGFQSLLGPKIKMSYLIVPEAFVEPAVKLWRIVSQGPDQIVLSAIASFLEDGQFAVHCKKIRAVYSDRMAGVAELCRARIEEAVVAEPRGGLHLALLLPPEIPSSAVCRIAARHKIGILPLDRFCLGNKENGIVLGIGICPDRHREQLITKLADIIHEAALENAARTAAE